MQPDDLQHPARTRTLLEAASTGEVSTVAARVPDRRVVLLTMWLETPAEHLGPGQTDLETLVSTTLN